MDDAPYIRNSMHHQQGAATSTRCICYTTTLSSYCIVKSLPAKMVTATVEDDAVAQRECLKNVFSMEGGQGEASYMNNSQVQATATQLVMF